MLKNDDQDDDEYCITSDDDELLTHLLQLWTTSVITYAYLCKYIFYKQLYM